VSASPASRANDAIGRYIVVVADGASIRAATPAGSTRVQRYSHVLHGYAADMSASQAAALLRDPAVTSVVPDAPVRIELGDVAAAKSHSTEIAPFGVVRIGGLDSPTARIDARDQRVHVDIAVLDTGVDKTHPDINYAGGKNCTSLPGGPGYDPQGHGTLVAGVAAAIDNHYGVVGVAPGAKIWSVRVLDADGTGTDSETLCGLDWVAAHADRLEVVNYSILIDGPDTPDCGAADNDTLHEAVCDVVGRGVTFVAAAGNSHVDTSDTVPAAYDETIAVSAMADYDGRPGGLAPTAPACQGLGDDDHFATFSNYGADIDLAAPGVCVSSTYPVWLCPQPATQCYATAFGGTSFSAPHVAGAAALYIATHPGATPAAVKAALIAAQEPGPIPDDPDSYPEGIVNVSTF
jgi:subtilisin family serine protease